MNFQNRTNPQDVAMTSLQKNAKNKTKQQPPTAELTL